MSDLANALIVVDTQVDFCPGGSLAVPDGDKCATRIHTFLHEHTDEYILIVATKCWHPSMADNVPGFDHFSKEPNFVNTWPPHCVAGTPGADFHPALGAMEVTSFRGTHGTRPSPIGDLFEFDKVFYKGQSSAAYSGFEGSNGGPLDKAAVAEVGFDPTLLHPYLQRHRIGHIDICGIATDYCVFATAMDGRRLAYDTTVLADLCVGVNETTTKTALEQMEEEGIHLDG